MLVLTRKLQQQIKIGDAITVTIVRIKGNTVRVGVEAPREVRVVRGELPKVESGNQAAGTGGDQTAVVAASADQGQAGNTVGRGQAAESDAAELAPLASATHLPLRRISSRYGSGPLKQIIASCNALAK
jgi:carbon storage regulator CsrA